MGFLGRVEWVCACQYLEQQFVPGTRKYAYCISRPRSAGRAAGTWMKGLAFNRILTIRRTHLNEVGFSSRTGAEFCDEV